MKREEQIIETLKRHKQATAMDLTNDIYKVCVFSTFIYNSINQLLYNNHIKTFVGHTSTPKNSRNDQCFTSFIQINQRRYGSTT